MVDQFFWCFSDPRGRLNREPFVLSILAIVALFFLTGHLIDEAMFGSQAIYYTSPKELDETLAKLRAPGHVLPGLLLFWPLLAVTLKRLHDIGRSWKSLLALLGTTIAAGTTLNGAGPIISWGTIGMLFFVKSMDGPLAREGTAVGSP